MDQAGWNMEDVAGFAARLAAFYEDLSPGARQIFVDLLREPVRKSADVAGYSMMEGAIPAATIATAVTDYLLRRAADAGPAHG
jgi:hypothetical protein